MVILVKSLPVTFEAIEETATQQVFVRLYLAYCMPTSSYDVSLNLDMIRKASQMCLFRRHRIGDFEMTILDDIGQLLSVNSLPAERVLRSIRRARTASDTKGRSHQSCSRSRYIPSTIPHRDRFQARTPAT